MHREKQYDMFDVVTGACTLEEYLNQRHNEHDLKSKVWIDKDDQVDELRQPEEPDPSGKTEPVVIPLQGPDFEKQKQRGHSAPVAAPPSTPDQRTPPSGPDRVAPQATPGADGRDRLATSASPTPSDGRDTLETQTPVDVPTGGISLAALAGHASPAEEEPAKPDMQALLSQFHQAKEAYQDRDEDE